MTTKVLFVSALGLGMAGLLSICDLCKTPAQAATAQAFGAQLALAAQAPAQAPAQQAAKTVTLDVQGMTCGGCAVGVRTALTRLPGVTKAEVSYEKHRAVVTYDPAKVSVAQMTAAIRALDKRYTATPVED